MLTAIWSTFKAFPITFQGDELRQQHHMKNIWTANSAKQNALRERWRALFAISAITVMAFISTGIAIWHTATITSQALV